MSESIVQTVTPELQEKIKEVMQILDGLSFENIITIMDRSLENIKSCPIVIKFQS